MGRGDFRWQINIKINLKAAFLKQGHMRPPVVYNICISWGEQSLFKMKMYLREYCAISHGLRSVALAKEWSGWYRKNFAFLHLYKAHPQMITYNISVADSLCKTVRVGTFSSNLGHRAGARPECWAETRCSRLNFNGASGTFGYKAVRQNFHKRVQDNTTGRI